MNTVSKKVAFLKKNALCHTYHREIVEHRLHEERRLRQREKEDEDEKEDVIASIASARTATTVLRGETVSTPPPLMEGDSSTIRPRFQRQWQRDKEDEDEEEDVIASIASTRPATTVRRERPFVQRRGWCVRPT